MTANEIVSEVCYIRTLGIVNIDTRFYGNGYYIEPTLLLEIETEEGDMYFGIMQVDEAYKTSIHSENTVAGGLKWGFKEPYLDEEKIEIVTSKPYILDEGEIEEIINFIYND